MTTKMAQEVWASFKLPWQISKWHSIVNYHQAPLAPPCIHWKSFLPQHDSKFSCQDIRELQLEKTVTYSQALQFRVEKANPPTQGQPCLLAGSIVELREEMKCYVSFPDEAVFSGMALPEEPSTIQLKDAASKSEQPMQTNSPVEEATAKITEEELSKKEQPPKSFPRLEGGVTPPRLVVVAGQIPPISWDSKQRPCIRSSGERVAQCQWAEDKLKAQYTKSEPTSPTRVLDVT